MRPANRGNKSGRSRLGITISRLLREGKYKILYAEHVRKREGIFVQSHGDNKATIIFDFDRMWESHANMADEMGEFLKAKGYSVEVKKGSDFIHVHVTPKGD